ncbi:MAG: DUF1553 domain-containing protein [Phycisphaera sp.]|nr:DUF1553 domain-containing protein [Phycisphaera sp.]
MHHDEDTEVYVNGRLIKKVTAFTRDYETFDLYDKAFKTIKQGDNVIAVHCKQTAGGQYIDVGLVTEAAPKDIDLLVKENGREVMSPEEVDHYADLVDQLKLAREKKIPEPGIKVLAVAEKGRAKTYVLGRGNPALQREEVQPGFPQVLGVPDPVIAEPKNGEHDKRRLALANWITSRDNPLTARVMMNRVWQHHFGRGIVPTANDFGKLGEMPTHPELLDWLAVEFMNRGWSVKAMHKLIMTSNAYRMSSADGASGLAKDPANMLFWRMNMRRLTAEEIRDTILAANGTLNLKMYGPSIYTEIPAAVLATASRPDQAWGKSTPEEAARRSVYIHVKRSLVEPFLQTFDLPDTDASCAMRFTTTVPTQALTCLNSDFMHKQASIFASRLRAEAGDNPADQVTLALKLVSGREPTQSEILRGVKVMDDWQTQDGITKEKSLDYFCLIALNLNEFLYLD